MRARSFGFLSNACKTKNIATIRSLLQGGDQIIDTSATTDSFPAPAMENEPVAGLPAEKPFIPIIVSNDISVFQSANRVGITFISPANAVIKSKTKESVAELMKRITGIDIELCKHCKIGRLQKTPLPLAMNQAPASWDTS